MAATKWHCARCSAELAMSAWFPFRCPNATETDRHHYLQIWDDGELTDPIEATHPFIAIDAELAWAKCAELHGMDADRRAALVIELDDAIKAVDGVGFHRTPFGRSNVLSDELGFDADGGVWVKDETGAVGGSQKARFLFSILLHLRAAEELGQLTERPPLAIASCGNAAVAAATLAKAADWPIDVYVPTWMDDGFGRRLDALDARVHRSERRDEDPAGDPAMFRFREAVAAGAIPFTVQGSENALCLDGGRTLGWEIIEQFRERGRGDPDAVFIQVGGGAFASATANALITSAAVPLYPVQMEGCAPLDRALSRARELKLFEVGPHWDDLMSVWDNPQSLADGILDDETYDWVDIHHALQVRGGRSVVAPEWTAAAAHEMAHRAGFDASPTGSAGLAGLLAALGPGRHDLPTSANVVVVMSGVTR
ncbi:MAG: threonine synthase [Candidatus Aldehydirespiratoraceae bacterium]|jgi:threonine synthase